MALGSVNPRVEASPIAPWTKNNSSLSPESQARYQRSFDTYMRTGQNVAPQTVPVGDRGVTRWNAAVNGPRLKAENERQANYKATWANNMAYSSLAPQYAGLQADTEYGAEQLRLGGMEAAAKLRFGQQNTANEIGKIKSGLQSGQDEFARAKEKNDLDLLGISIDEKYLARQKEYLAQMLGYTNRDLNLQDSIRNVDLGAVERQFPLLAKEREDLGALQQNLMANFDAADVAATKDERVKQLDMISQAAANGAAGAAGGVMRAQRLAEQLQEGLAQSQRDRADAKIKYEAALRDNTEKMAQATDAKQKIIYEKQRIQIEKERAAAEAAEAEKRRQEDVQRKALERFYAAVALQQARDQLAAQQRNAFLAMANAQNQQAQNAFFAELNRQQQVAAFIAQVQKNQAAEAQLRIQQQQAAARYLPNAPSTPDYSQYGTAAQTAARQGRVAGVR